MHHSALTTPHSAFTEQERFMRKAIISDKAPKPRGPYSPAIIASGPTVYGSSRGPIDPATDQFFNGTFS